MIVNDEKIIIDGDKVTRECDICDNIQHIKLEEEGLVKSSSAPQASFLIELAFSRLGLVE